MIASKQRTIPGWKNIVDFHVDISLKKIHMRAVSKPELVDEPATSLMVLFR